MKGPHKHAVTGEGCRTIWESQKPGFPLSEKFLWLTYFMFRYEGLLKTDNAR